MSLLSGPKLQSQSPPGFKERDILHFPSRQQFIENAKTLPRESHFCLLKDSCVNQSDQAQHPAAPSWVSSFTPVWVRKHEKRLYWWKTAVNKGLSITVVMVIWCPCRTKTRQFLFTRTSSNSTTRKGEWDPSDRAGWNAPLTKTPPARGWVHRTAFSLSVHTHTHLYVQMHMCHHVYSGRSVIQREVNSKLMMPISARYTQQFGSIQKCFLLWVQSSWIGWWRQQWLSLRDPQMAGWCLYFPTCLSSQVRVRLQGGFTALSPPAAPFAGIYITLNLGWLI